MTTHCTAFEKIQQSADLPRLPQVMLKLIQAVENDSADAGELSSIIATDPALSSKLMDLIGSAYFSLPREIASIESAVLYLGTDTIRQLAISSSALHIFRGSIGPEEFDIQSFWHHSYTCAVLSRKIAAAIGYPQPDEAFLSGLLHDIGRLMLIAAFPDDYRLIQEQNVSEDELVSSELKAFDTSSPEVSAWAFDRWRLSSLASDSVRYLFEPLDEIRGGLDLVRILYTAHRALIDPNAGSSSDLLDLTGLAPHQLAAMIEDAGIVASQTAEQLGISIHTDQAGSGTDGDLAAVETALDEKVRQTNLLFGTLQALFSADDLETALRAVANGLKIIFSVPRLFYFLIDDQKRLLTGWSLPHDRNRKVVNSIAVPFANGASLLARALTSGKPVLAIDESETSRPAISDRQIIRLLETPTMACLPMTAGRDPIGVIVLGVNQQQVEALKNQQDLLMLFARQAAVCIQNIRFRTDYATILQNERMQAFSAITRKIVHEVNNPIVIITNYLKMLSMKLPDKHPVQDDLTVIREEVDRVAGLVSGLTDFSKPEIKEFTPVDVNALFTSVLEVIRKSLLQPRRITASITTDPSVPIIKSDKDGLKQVLINLLKNAAEAMENGGEIRITTTFISESAKILIDEKKRVPGTIEIVIADNGPGIPPAVLEKLFEPYNSTKNRKNSGLGLSIVHSIIKLLNGTIACDSNPGGGTSFRILLPVTSTKGNLRLS